MTMPRLTEQEIAELCDVLIWSRAHYAHHDPKGTAGANCPACLAGIRARELTDRLLAEREEMAKRNENLRQTADDRGAALSKAEKELEEARALFGCIERWEMPPAEFKGVPCSYGSAYGSNGERDYIRAMARDYLARQAEPKQKGGER